ncbi:MAG: hypothetical protein V4650_08905 [Pseudomonadota bacterium]
MDIIWNALQYSALLNIVLLAIAIFVVSRFTSHSYDDVQAGDRVPQHKRFERRDDGQADRRYPRSQAFRGIERRLGLRRTTA